MIPYRDEKIKAAIYFFASEHKKKTKNNLYQTFLYKYLAFFDFRSLEETGQPALGLSYFALERGPVPDEIYNFDDYCNTDLYEFIEDDKGVIIKPLVDAKPDYDCFSKYEMELLNNLVEIFAESYITSNMISDASHEEIMAWRRTWKKKPNSIIKYIDDFPGNLLNKPPDELNNVEEHFLLFSAINKIS